MRYQLVKSIHVLVELVTACELGVFCSESYSLYSFIWHVQALIVQGSRFLYLSHNKLYRV